MTSKDFPTHNATTLEIMKRLIKAFYIFIGVFIFCFLFALSAFIYTTIQQQNVYIEALTTLLGVDIEIVKGAEIIMQEIPSNFSNNNITKKGN